MAECYEKVYVRVSVEFDEAGTMLPRSLTWDDGRVYPIDRVLDIRPAASRKTGGQGDRYTVVIAGQQRYLFFEHSADRFGIHLGRWFVAAHVPDSA